VRGFFAITRREIGERRLLFAAAALTSLIPLIAPFVPGNGAASAVDVRGWTALLISFAFAAGISIGLGGTMCPPSIASRRIGFDFAKPVSAFAIWGGRIAAALLLAVATATLVWIPARLSGATLPWKELLTQREVSLTWLLLALGALIVVFCVCHAATLALRSRSALTGLDALLAVAAWFGVSAALSRLPLFMAAVPFQRAAVGFAIAAGAALAAAGYASVARGRTDIGAAHRALSLVLWTAIGAGVVGVNGYASWVMSAKPGDLEQDLWASPASAGTWIQLEGRARGARATFLYDTAAERFARTPTVDWRGPVVSANGTRAAWIQGNADGGPFPLWTWRLDDPKAEPARTRLLVAGYPSLMELSADGSRLATMEAGLLLVRDLASERVLVSARFPTRERQGVRGLFIDNDRLRIFRTDETTFDIFELDAPSRTLRTIGSIGELNSLRFFVSDPTGGRIIVVDEPNRRTRLFDGGSGALLATLGDAPAQSRWPRFLSGGRIGVTEGSDAGLRLRLYGQDGAPLTTIPMPPGRQAVTGGEVAPGQLVVGIGDEGSHGTVWLVDLDAATIRKIADDLWPVRSLWTSPDIGSPATKLFYGPGQRSLVYFDPLTGKRRVVLGTGS